MNLALESRVSIPLAQGGCFLLLSMLLVGCSSDSDGTDASVDTDLALNFEAAVNGAPFVACDEYAIGTSTRPTRVSDFRALISNPRLIDVEGTQTPLALDQDGVWQLENIALLDFEDGCGAGTPQTNDQVRGQVPAVDYTGLCFELGVPFERNHLDSAAQPSPLNVSGMYWSWQGGYKFLRVDMTGDPGPDESFANQGYLLHLGSTACASAGPQQAPDAACGFPNRPTMCLTDFDPSADRVRFDIGTLLAESDTTVNTPDTAQGCMSGNDDPECQVLIPRLGLDFTYTDGQADNPQLFEAQPQQFVSIVRDTV